jgi:transposase
MAYASDLRWRAVVLVFLYSIEPDFVGAILGVSERTVRRWLRCFERTGSPSPTQALSKKKSRWPTHVLEFVQLYVENHPCFYIEELQAELRSKFDDVKNVSVSTICRALRFDLSLTRKVLTKRARESAPKERREYAARLLPFYSGPDQLVFVDETSKDGRYDRQNSG